MKWLANLYEFEFWGVYDRGIANGERIVFKPRLPVDMTQFAVILAEQGSGLIVRPYFDQTFWFPDVKIQPPAWIFIFTCPGTPTITREQSTQEPLHALFWGKATTVFNRPNLIPVIVRIDGMLQPPAESRQLSRPQEIRGALPGTSKTKT